MQTINPSQFNTKHITNTLTVYSATQNNIEINSIEAALNPDTWKNNFNPFAYVVIDSKKNEIVLARDHLGVAPLYFYYENNQFIFGDSLPDILNQLEKKPEYIEKQIEMLFSENKIYSDETFYKHIYRVEPGTLIYLHHYQKEKRFFWKLEPKGDVLIYKTDQEYLDHFSELMRESIALATQNPHNIAAEFSAGIDSSAVICAARERGLNPTLYMHMAMPDTKADKIYNRDYEKQFIDYLKLTNIQRIDDSDFDPIAVFKEQSQWFAGSAPYIFFMFANNIHQAVSKAKHPILLSGFGGDQCLSAEMPLHFFMPELMREKKYREAFRYVAHRRWVNQLTTLCQFTHPSLYAFSLKIRNAKQAVKNIFLEKAEKKPPLIHSYYTQFYPSMREAEWSFLQGFQSHEVRMRIEYSSVISKKMGFEYRYPLLYPKLMEFFLRLPLNQKRRNNQGRYLMRRYMAQHLPPEIFNTYRKPEGLGIVPGTFDSFKKKLAAGDYHAIFSDLPFKELIINKRQHFEINNTVKAFMMQQGLQ